MKYYSDLTNKIYETMDELKEAEKAHNDKLELQKKKDEERKADYQKVKDAYALAEAQKKAADKLLQQFLEKYKGVHKTTDKTQFLNSKQYMDDQKELINSIFSVFPLILF
jgi:hypothetical protein